MFLERYKGQYHTLVELMGKENEFQEEVDEACGLIDKKAITGRM